MYLKRWTTRLPGMGPTNCFSKVRCAGLLLLLMTMSAAGQNAPANPNNASSPSATVTERFWNDQNYLLGDGAGNVLSWRPKELTSPFITSATFWAILLADAVRHLRTGGESAARSMWISES